MASRFYGIIWSSLKGGDLKWRYSKYCPVILELVLEQFGGSGDKLHLLFGNSELKNVKTEAPFWIYQMWFLTLVLITAVICGCMLLLSSFKCSAGDHLHNEYIHLLDISPLCIVTLLPSCFRISLTSCYHYLGHT